MKEYLKLSEAMKALEKEFGCIPLSSVRKALNNHLIPHMKSSQGKRASNLVRVEDLRKYYETLKR